MNFFSNFNSCETNLNLIGDRNNYFMINRNKKASLDSKNPITLEFIDAIKYNNFEKLEQLFLQHGNLEDNNHLTPLKIAVTCSNILAVDKILCLSHSKINDSSVIPLACEINDMPITKKLLEMIHTSPHIITHEVGGSMNETSLFYAISNNNIELVEIILRNPFISFDRDSKQSYLLKALYDRKSKIAELLIKHPSFKLLDKEIETVFDLGTDEIIKSLMEGDKINLTNVDSQFIKLIRRNDIQIPTLELFYPYIDLNFSDLYHNTALIYICSQGNTERLTSFLRIEKMPRVDLTITNELQMNCLMCAVHNGFYTSVSILLEYIKQNCDEETIQKIITQKNKMNENTILLAVNKDESMVDLLFKYFKFDLNCRNIQGSTPFIIAITKGNKSMFDSFIKDSTLDINLQDLDGLTPLMHVIKLADFKFNPASLIDPDLHPNNNILAMNPYVHFIFELLRHPQLDINRKNNYGHSGLFYMILKKYGLIDTSGLKANILDPYVNDTMSKFPDSCSYSMNPQLQIVSSNTSCYNHLISIMIRNPHIDLNSSDRVGSRVLTYVIDNKDSDLFSTLLNEEKLDINQRDKNGKTYLMKLFENCNECNISSLSSPRSLTQTIEPNDELSNFYSLNVDTFKDAKLRYDTNCYQKCFTPSLDNKNNLYSNKIYVCMLTQLLGHPLLDINAQDYYGNTILINSITECKAPLNIFYLILENKNVNLDLQNFEGVTALMLAVQKGLWENAKLLIKAGGKTDIKNNEGKTILELLNTNKDKYFLNNLVNIQQKKGWFF
jgi:ankyrin repeat protein